MAPSRSRSASWMARSAMLCSCSSVTCIPSIARSTCESQLSTNQTINLQLWSLWNSSNLSDRHFSAEASFPRLQSFLVVYLKGQFWALFIPSSIYLFPLAHIIIRHRMLFNFYADNTQFYLPLIPIHFFLGGATVEIIKSVTSCVIAEVVVS